MIGSSDQYSPAPYHSSDCLGGGAGGGAYTGTDIFGRAGSGGGGSGGSKTLVVSCDLVTPTSQDLLHTDLRQLTRMQQQQECGAHCPFATYDSLPRRTAAGGGGCPGGGCPGPQAPVRPQRVGGQGGGVAATTRIYECPLAERLEYS